jgi:methionine-rich copper-binding protein CopC
MTRIYLLLVVLVGMITLNLSAQTFNTTFTVTAPASIAGPIPFVAGTWTTAPVGSSLTSCGNLKFTGNDSLACLPTSTPTPGNQLDSNTYKGNWVLVRRGSCGFADKVNNVRNAKGSGILIYQSVIDPPFAAGGVPTAAVTGGMTDRATGWKLRNAITSGTAVNVCYESKRVSVYDAYAPYQLKTPIEHVATLETMGGTVQTAVDISDLVATITITEPNGTKVNFSTTPSAVKADTIYTVTIREDYTPTEVGTYKVDFTTSASTTDVATFNFEITPEKSSTNLISCFANDLGIVNKTTGTPPATQSGIIATAGVTAGGCAMGHMYVSGSADSTYISEVGFAITTNALDTLANGTRLGASIYALPRDPATGDFPGQGTIILDNPDIVTLVGVGEVTVDQFTGARYFVVNINDILSERKYASIPPDHGIIVLASWDAPVPLPATVKNPFFSYANRQVMPIYDELVVADRISAPGQDVGGFAGAYGFILRAFEAPLGTSSNEPRLLDSQLKGYPNPVTDLYNLEFNLNTNSINNTVRVFDMNGKQVLTQQVDNISKGVIPVNVSTLPAGAYNVRISTEQGYRVLGFMKM